MVFPQLKTGCMRFAPTWNVEPSQRETLPGCNKLCDQSIQVGLVSWETAVVQELDRLFQECPEAEMKELDSQGFAAQLTAIEQKKVAVEQFVTEV